MRTKPQKPSPDFPLYAHASGKWAKKVGGKLRYFGVWSDPDGALKEYQRWRGEYDARTKTPTLAELRKRLPRKFELPLGEAVNLFLADKQAHADRGEISHRTCREHRDTCQRLVSFLGDQKIASEISPADFAAFRDHRAKTLNLVSLGNEVTRVKTLFRWLHASRHLQHPANFGPSFRKPSARLLRRHRREQGKKLFSAMDVTKLIHEAGTHLRAMIYLGINCGFGPNDCCQLPFNAVDLEAGWIDFPRPKTEVDRLCPLWPETVKALRLSLDARSLLSDSLSPMFFLDGGKPWRNDQAQLSKYFTAVRRRALPDGGFYWLRHTFETVAGGAKDQVAVNAIMGHVDNSMAAVYREEISPLRLKAASDHVRDWLLTPSVASGIKQRAVR